MVEGGGVNLNPPFPLEMLLQNFHVTKVGAESDVEHITEEWHRADDALDRDIAKHAREHMFRNLQTARLIESPA